MRDKRRSVGRADDLAAADPGAGEDGREDGRPVVAAGLHDLGRPAELAGDDDQRLVEQAGLREVVEQGRRRPCRARAGAST